jgi:hypothetical protein
MNIPPKKTSSQGCRDRRGVIFLFEKARKEERSLLVPKNEEPVILVRDVNISPLVYDDILRLRGQFFGKQPPFFLG